MPEFVEMGSPTDVELHALLQTVITRLMKMLTRRGELVEEMGQTYLAEPDGNADEAPTLRPPKFDTAAPEVGLRTGLNAFRNNDLRSSGRLFLRSAVVASLGV